MKIQGNLYGMKMGSEIKHRRANSPEQEITKATKYEKDDQNQSLNSRTRDPEIQL